MTDFALPPPSNRRPQSLQQAALWGSRRGETDHYLREFLDVFYLADSAPERTQMLLGEPSLSGNERRDAYFAAVAEHLSAKAAEVMVDLTIYDGTAMSLLFDTRQATRDVDAVARGAVDFIRSFVAEIAEQEGSPSDGLNDGVQGFVSANAQARPSCSACSGASSTKPVRAALDTVQPTMRRANTSMMKVVYTKPVP